MLKQRQQLFVTLLAAMDGVVVLCACYAAWAYRVMQFGAPWPDFSEPHGWRGMIQQALVIFVVPTALVAMRVCGLYRPWRDRRMLTEFRHVANAAMVTIVAVIVLVWMLGTDALGGWDSAQKITLWGGLSLDAGRLQLAALAVFLPALLMLERALFRAVLRQVRSRGLNLRHVAVIGTGRLGRIACRTLDRNAWTGLHVTYFIDHRDAVSARESIIQRPVRGGLRDLEAVLDEHPVDAVYLCLPNTRAGHIPQVIRRLERYPLDVRVIPDVSPRYVPLSMTVNELEGMPILSVRESPLNGVGGAVKRLLDIGGAFAGLVVFVPVMAFVWTAIKWTSPGPVIFKQRRVSLGGEEFDILKFRTMHHVEDERRAGESSPVWTARNDPRVTSIGKFLRKTSLDELPQLFNVLRGDMSLVGPRPERPELISRFREDWRGYMLRQHVKAGITGWAQVNGHRGDTGLRKRLQHDLFYIRHWSLAFDLKILLLTFVRGFVHSNAH